MEVLLGAATLAITRAGASTLAELAASGLVSVLVPYPRASDNHQYYNARALADTGAALMLEEASASPGALISTVRGLVDNEEERRLMRDALRRWHRSEAAVQIASEIMSRIGLTLLRDIEGGRAAAAAGPGPVAGGAGSAPGKVRGELQESLHG
jgi:UDP-N-acetylglucosamine--N-acetylmuramyl-(pentapeptide) pyrophosphoryl-undecaprenol N-acetylglucosamine transferase